MKRSQYFGASILALAIFALTGCGGGGSDSSGGGGGGGTPVSGTFTLAAHLAVTGGFNLNQTYPAGTDTLVLQDGEGHNTTFSNVFVPLALTGGNITIIRAGSKLFAGSYSSTTALCIDQGTGAQANVPLNNDGSLKQDTAVDSLKYIQLPITADGALTFQNGVQASADASAISNNTADMMLTLTTSAGSIPASGGSSFPGTLSFSGTGTANTNADVSVSCINSAQNAVLSFSGITIAPSKTVGITGDIAGNLLPYSSAKVGFSISQ